MPQFIPETSNFSEVTRLPADVKKACLKENLKGTKNLINNQTFIMEEPDKGEPLQPCMYVYKAKIQSDVSLDKLKLRIVVRGDLHNKEIIGDTWDPTALMRTLKYFLAYSTKHKSRVHQLDFIG